MKKRPTTTMGAVTPDVKNSDISILVGYGFAF